MHFTHRRFETIGAGSLILLAALGVAIAKAPSPTPTPHGGVADAPGVPSVPVAPSPSLGAGIDPARHPAHRGPAYGLGAHRPQATAGAGATTDHAPQVIAGDSPAAQGTVPVPRPSHRADTTGGTVVGAQVTLLGTVVRLRATVPGSPPSRGVG
jgi:hypothetical protein